MRDDEMRRERARWRNAPRGRPRRIERPGPGQESVWDYPRPPRLEPEGRPVRIEHAGCLVAHSERALRVCETASPPVVYVPPDDVCVALRPVEGYETFCEWKGLARYFDLEVDSVRAEKVAWSYPQPDRGFEALRDYVAFFPGRVDHCQLGDHRVRPQPGDFYGGWITPEILGPFKGEPGTGGW